MTCAHVIEDPTNHNPIAQSHLESDRYILLNHDDEDNFHYHIGSFKKGTDLTIQLDYDLAIVDVVRTVNRPVLTQMYAGRYPNEAVRFGVSHEGSESK